jgi:hypothetical protein
VTCCTTSNCNTSTTMILQPILFFLSFIITLFVWNYFFVFTEIYKKKNNVWMCGFFENK